jgi:hypothetical protein
MASPAGQSPQQGTCADTALLVEPDSEAPHWMLPILEGRRPLQMDAKVKTLISFKNLNLRQVLKQDSLSDSDALELDTMTNKDEKALNRMGASVIASLLVKIVQALENHDMLVEAAGKQKSRPSSEPPAIKQLRKLIRNCEEIHKERQLQEASKKQKETKPWQPKLKNQDSNGNRLQKSHTFDSDEAQTEEECPYCRQKTVNALDTMDSIEEKNKAILEAHERALKECEKDKTKKKPRAKPAVSQRLACFSYLQNCLMNPSGSGCFACKGLYQATGKAPEHVSHPNGCGRVCACQICQSSCSAAFFRHERSKIILEKALELNGVVGKFTCNVSLVLFARSF